MSGSRSHSADGAGDFANLTLRQAQDEGSCSAGPSSNALILSLSKGEAGNARAMHQDET